MFSGESIRNMRLKKSLTLQALSNLSGISKSMLSEIENNKKTPTIELILRISDALGVHVSSLVDNPSKANEPTIFIKADYQQTFLDPVTKTELHFISHHSEKTGLEFIYAITPSNNITEVFSPSLATIKYFYIVQGILQIRLGEDTYKLSKGDYLSFNADIEQQYTSIGSDDCHYYVIVNRLPY